MPHLLRKPPLVLYEYPLNEGIRTMLRLEHLFQRLGQLIQRDAAIDHHFALVTIFEVMDVSARADLKSDVLKELERHKAQLNAYRGNPAVSEAALDDIVGRIERSHDALNAQGGKAGAVLTSNDWLMAIRSRINIPAGTCAFDLPGYFAWQHRSPDQRRADLAEWAEPLAALADALQVLLGLLRDSGSAQRMHATGGTHQQRLPEGRGYQLLRLRIDESLGLVPEISGHRLLVSVRLMRAEADGRLKPANEDADFELALCA